MTHTLPMFTAGEDLPLFTGQPVAVQPATFTPKPYYRQLRLEQETSTMTHQDIKRNKYYIARRISSDDHDSQMWELEPGTYSREGEASKIVMDYNHRMLPVGQPADPNFQNRMWFKGTEILERPGRFGL